MAARVERLLDRARGRGDAWWKSYLSRYVEALGADDRSACVTLVEEVLAAGAGPGDLIERLIAPAQHQIGTMWAQGRWTVRQEHAATAISSTVLAEVMEEASTSSAATAPSGEALLVVCVEQEWHAFPATLLAARLQIRGHQVHLLGPNTPVASLGRHVFETSPRAVLLSCSLVSHLSVARRGVEAVRQSGTPVVVGGPAFDGAGLRAARLGATAYAADALALEALLSDLPTAVTPAEPLLHEGAAEGFTLYAERERHAEVVVAELGRAGVLDDKLVADPSAAHERALEAGPGQDWPALLVEQAIHLVGSVSGALVVDDPSVMEQTWEWLDLVLGHRLAPAGVPHHVRSALRHAVRELPRAEALVAASVRG